MSTTSCDRRYTDDVIRELQRISAECEAKGKVSYIYTLSDPDTNQVVYVGKAADPKKRFYGHLTGASNAQVKSGQWIKTLLQANKQPVMNIIDECPSSQVLKIEQEWITAYLVSGSRLLNTMIMGGYIHHPKAIRFLADNLPHDCKCYLCGQKTSFDNIIVLCLGSKETHWKCKDCYNRPITFTRDELYD